MKEIRSGATRLYLEGKKGSFIELSSCLVAEFDQVYELAQKFLMASNSGDMAEAVNEICDAFAAKINANELTLDDAWNILLIKAGTAKKELLEILRNAQSKALEAFLSGKTLGRKLEELAATLEIGCQDTLPQSPLPEDKA
jgi:hypothetical protein